MTTRTQKILGWTPTILVSLFMILASGLPKFFIEPGTPTADFVGLLGVNNILIGVGVLEVLVGILLLIPRTSTVGFVLLIGLLGGAMATGLTHEAPGNWPYFPLVIIALASLGAYFRNPELLARIQKKSVPKTSTAGKVVSWICVGLIALFHAPALYFKYFPATGPEAEAMSASLGLNLIDERMLGIVQALVLVLFIIPRTSTVGFILMIGYMGGVLATSLTHGYSHMDAIPLYIAFAVLTLCAYFRNPELVSRLKGKNV